MVIALLVAGGTFWLLSPKKSPSLTAPTTPAPALGFPSGANKARPKDDSGGREPAGPDHKTGNGFLAPAQIAGTFQEIAKEAVAGAVAVERKKADGSKVVFVRYIERATGHVKEVLPGQSDASRIANTTIPKVAEAFFSPTGDATILRVLTDPFNEVATVLARIVAATSTDEAAGKLDGVTLPEKVSSLALSPDGKRAFTIVLDANGAGGILQDVTGKNRKEIWRSPLSEWTARWGNANSIFLTTKASVNVPGYLYNLNAQSGTFTRVLSGNAGLTTLPSSDGGHIFVTEASKRGLMSYLFMPSTEQKTAFPLTTLPEKCAWSLRVPTELYCAVPDTNVPFNALPDAWYRGDLSFSDSFWRVDTKTMETKLLGTPNQSVDAINLGLSPSEDLLLFTDKSDGHLWALRISE